MNIDNSDTSQKKDCGDGIEDVRQRLLDLTNKPKILTDSEDGRLAVVGASYIFFQLYTDKNSHLLNEIHDRLIIIVQTLFHHKDKTVNLFNLFLEKFKGGRTSLDFCLDFLNPFLQQLCQTEEDKGEAYLLNLEDDKVRDLLSGVFMVIFKIAVCDIKADTLLSYLHKEAPGKFSLPVWDLDAHYKWVRETYGLSCYNLSGFQRQMEAFKADTDSEENQKGIEMAKTDIKRLTEEVEYVLPNYVHTPLTGFEIDDPQVEEFKECLKRMLADEKKKKGLGMMFATGVLAIIFFPNLDYVRDAITTIEGGQKCFDSFSKMAGKEWINFYNSLSGIEGKVGRFSFLCGLCFAAMAQEIAPGKGILGLKAGLVGEM